MNYYLGINGQQSGPFTEDQLRQKLASGAIQPTDLCWRDGFAEWVPVSQAMWMASAPTQYAAEPAQFAGFWLRVLAFIIDWLILLIPSYVIGFISGSVIGPAMASGGSSKNAIVITSALSGAVLGTILNWLYYALMESSRFQATFGKLSISLRVTDESGGRISFGRATGRYFGKIVSTMIFDIGFMMAGFTARKQALHDMMAGCLVIRK